MGLRPVAFGMDRAEVVVAVGSAKAESHRVVDLVRALYRANTDAADAFMGLEDPGPAGRSHSAADNQVASPGSAAGCGAGRVISEVQGRSVGQRSDAR